MTAKVRIIWGSLTLVALAGWNATISAATAADSKPSAARITVLYDAFGSPSSMQKDWGYAALVEYDGKRILFDTGNNPDILKQNAKAKGINLANLDFVVMSHRHGDHMGA
jgi:7,8-dihydropterin-6-yl-methyl-4-(beta-D-ribofuranosyl)aminobenzene 5'-phosphate synthase